VTRRKMSRTYSDNIISSTSNDVVCIVPLGSTPLGALAPTFVSLSRARNHHCNSFIQFERWMDGWLERQTPRQTGRRGAVRSRVPVLDVVATTIYRSERINERTNVKAFCALRIASIRSKSKIQSTDGRRTRYGRRDVRGCVGDAR